MTRRQLTLALQAVACFTAGIAAPGLLTALFDLPMVAAIVLGTSGGIAGGVIGTARYLFPLVDGD